MDTTTKSTVRQLARALVAGIAVFAGLQLAHHIFLKGLAIAFAIALLYWAFDRFVLARWIQARSQ